MIEANSNAKLRIDAKAFMKSGTEATQKPGNIVVAFMKSRPKATVKLRIDAEEFMVSDTGATQRHALPEKRLWKHGQK